MSSSGPKNDRRIELRAEWDKIRQEQGNFKGSRSKIMDQLKVINEGIQKKVCLFLSRQPLGISHLAFSQVKDLNVAKAKTPYKTVAEVDARIQSVACCHDYIFIIIDEPSTTGNWTNRWNLAV